MALSEEAIPIPEPALMTTSLLLCLEHLKRGKMLSVLTLTIKLASVNGSGRLLARKVPFVALYHVETISRMTCG